MVAWIVFGVGALIVLIGGIGVVTRENPVHAALSLVATLFGVAVLFVAQDAEFLAVVQVIVYAGAIVVLFLFVIMLIGVDREEDIDFEPLGGQRPAAILAGVLLVAGLGAVVILGKVTGARGNRADIDPDLPNVAQIGRVLFTDYLWAFEITSILLVIAVVGAVALARHRPDRQVDDHLLPHDQVDEAVLGLAWEDDDIDEADIETEEVGR